VSTPCPRLTTLNYQAQILEALRLNQYIPQFPTAKQAYALLLPHLEVLFGGAAGGGKSSWLLMAALQYVDVPGYAAILFRRTYAELSKPEALMERAHEWLRSTDAHWDGLRHTYIFPSGAQLVFSHLEHEASKYEHQSAAYMFVGFDEASSFTESMYRYLFSRLRRLEGFPVPLRLRAASNPGNIGHAFLKQRFMVEHDPARAFVPARAIDNPYLDIAAYEQSLAQLDPVTRARLWRGDWDISEEGKLFQAQWFRLVQDWPRGQRLVRFWDFAATEEKRSARGEIVNDPDWTVGTLVTECQGQYWVIDMQRVRLTPKGVEDLVLQTAQRDGPRVEVWLEQEPGSSGVKTVDDFQRRILKGYTVHGLRSTGPKLERARPVSSAAEAGNIFLVEGHWNKALLEEICLVAGTEIETVHGSIPIEHVRVGEKVLTRDGWKEVCKAERTYGAKHVIILHAGRHVLKGTPTHPVWIEGKGFVPFKDIQLGDRVLCLVPYPLSTKPHAKRLSIAGCPFIATLHQNVLGNVSIFLAIGKEKILTSIELSIKKKWGRFLTDFMSIIKMTILKTMSQTIWKSFRLKPIIHGIASIVLGRSISVASVKTSSAPSLSPRSITVPVDVPMPLDVLREKNGLWSASTVKALLSRLNRISAFVVSVAQRWRCGKQRWQTKSYNPNPALSVESYSCLRATGYAVHAIVVSSLDIDPVPKPVYNLQVQECPEYFANGILVHNCLLGTPGVHDDIADTLSGAFAVFSAQRRAGTWGTR